MTDTDIVEHLRRNAVFNHRDTYIAAADEIERLRKERDEARLEVCTLSSNGSIDDASRQAKARGWDYLAEEK